MQNGTGTEVGEKKNQLKYLRGIGGRVVGINVSEKKVNQDSSGQQRSRL